MNKNIGEYWITKELTTLSDEFSLYFSIEQRLSDKQIHELELPLNKTYFRILKYMEIYESFRKKGFGKILLDQIKMESSNSIVLICEMKDDFLLDFYLKNGFEQIRTDYFLPILIFRR